MSEIKQKNFLMKLEDIKWMLGVREAAVEGKVGYVSTSQVLEDICEYCRSNGYRYRDWAGRD